MSNYIAHDCRNCRNGSCNNRWIDKDITKAKNRIPTWKYCKECCKKLGIDFYSQTPNDYRTEKQKLNIKKRVSKLFERPT